MEKEIIVLSVQQLALQKQLSYLESLPYKTFSIQKQISIIKKKLQLLEHDGQTLSTSEGGLNAQGRVHYKVKKGA